MGAKLVGRIAEFENEWVFVFKPRSSFIPNLVLKRGSCAGYDRQKYNKV